MLWRFITTLFTFLSVLLIANLLFFYFFFPSGGEFSLKPSFKEKNYNFSLSGGDSVQFYENLRYPSKEISYKISPACSLQKKYDVEQAIEILDNETILEFNPVNSNEDITVACEDKIKTEESFFVAGEGGPINITRTENFNVILYGGILLLRDSKCERPNVALHEILHALGFDHSTNPNNIMYNISKCDQTIGSDLVKSINEIYSVPSLPDLSFENVSASVHGRFLDLNISVRNNGLDDVLLAKVIIYVDGKKIKEVSLGDLDIGYGVSLTLANILVTQINIKEINLEIKYDFDELNKEDNKITLEIKK